MVGGHHQEVAEHPPPQGNGVATPDTPREDTEEGRGHSGGTSCSQPPGCEPAVGWFSHPKKLLCSAVRQMSWGEVGVQASCRLVWTQVGVQKVWLQASDCLQGVRS